MRKKFWIIFLAVFLVASISAVNFAQARRKASAKPNSIAAGAPQFEDRAQSRTDRLKRRLNLTDQQAEQIDAIFADHQKTMKKFHEQMKTEREKTHAEVEKVLTEEQKAQFNQMRSKRKDRLQQGKARKRRFHRQRQLDADKS